MVPTNDRIGKIISRHGMPLHLIHFSNIKAQGKVLGLFAGISVPYVGPWKCEYQHKGKVKETVVDVFVLTASQYREIREKFPVPNGFVLFKQKRPGQLPRAVE